MTTATLSPNYAPIVQYETTLEQEITQLSHLIEAKPELVSLYRPRWLAIQLLEGDPALTAEIESWGANSLLQAVAQSQHRLEAHYGEEIDVIIAEHRYSFVHQLVNQVMSRRDDDQLTLSDKIDQIVTHKILGIPIFLALMWVVFKITADVSSPFVDWIDGVITGPLTRWLIAGLTLISLDGTWLQSLLVEGVIASVGGVLVFVPVLMSLYMALAILEDSGYMARAAFVMERPMRAIGLPGQSFMPMIVGFGCNVPGYYATRILENKKDRILTGLLIPFMSCGARLPVYVLFAAIFFPNYTGPVVFGMYLLGIVIAIGLGFILNRTLFKESEPSPLVMELPPYRLPTLTNIWLPTKSRTWSFVRKAWTIIFVTSIVVWFLMATPVKGEGRFADTDVEDSAFATVAQTISPALAPLGFGNWESTSSLLTGFIAKEVIISTMAQTHQLDEIDPSTTEPERFTFAQEVQQIGLSFGEAVLESLRMLPSIVGINLTDDTDDGPTTALMAAVQQDFEISSGGHGNLAALAFMIFVLTYAPCMAAVAAEKQEFGLKWVWFSIIGQTVLAWLLGLLVFQGGLLLGF